MKGDFEYEGKLWIWRVTLNIKGDFETLNPTLDPTLNPTIKKDTFYKKGHFVSKGTLWI